MKEYISCQYTEDDEFLIDREKNRRLIKGLFELSQSELIILKKDIEYCSGIIRVFIHPYYRKNNEVLQIDEKQKQRYEKGLKLMFESISMEKPPVFIMEEKIAVPNFISEVIKILKDKVYLIKTHEDTAEPDIIEQSGDYENDVKKNWTELIEKLKSLGVKKIIIGGREFIVDSFDNKKVTACVGNAINNLSKDFEIEISNLVLPDEKNN